MATTSDEYLQLTITRVDDSWDSTKRVVEFTPHGKRNDEWVEAALKKFEKNSENYLVP